MLKFLARHSPHVKSQGNRIRHRRKTTGLDTGCMLNTEYGTWEVGLSINITSVLVISIAYVQESLFSWSAWALERAVQASHLRCSTMAGTGEHTMSLPLTPSTKQGTLTEQCSAGGVVAAACSWWWLCPALLRHLPTSYLWFPCLISTISFDDLFWCIFLPATVRFENRRDDPPRDVRQAQHGAQETLTHKARVSQIAVLAPGAYFCSCCKQATDVCAASPVHRQPSAHALRNWQGQSDLPLTEGNTLIKQLSL